MSVVIGGGISGLATAHYLKQCSVKKVTVLEAAQRVGGWIQSTSLPNKLIFEHGPRTIRPKGEAGVNTLALIEELGLADKVVPIRSNHPAALNRFIYVKGQLCKLPSNISSLFVTKPPFTKPLVTSLFQDLRAPKKVAIDESIYDFVERRLGKEIAEYAISPMICGICAGDAREISVKFIMKSLFEAEQNFGSIGRGLFKGFFNKKSKPPSVTCPLSKRALQQKWSVWSLNGGLEQFPQVLKDYIIERGVDVNVNTSCQAIYFDDSGKAIIRMNGPTSSNTELMCDHIYSSIPAVKLAPLLHTQHPNLSKELEGIPTVTVAVVNLSYQGKVLNHDAFGFLIPPAENNPILGVIYDSCCFPKGDSTVLTVMMGGKWFNKWFSGSSSPDFFLNTAIKQLQTILGITAKPESYKTNILKDCIPQYVVGHHERLERIRDYIKKNKLPLSLIGSSYDGVGVNDVIMSAKKAVETVAQD